MNAADSTARRLLEELQRACRTLTDSLLSQNTKTGYQYDWLDFERWCARMDLDPLPATAETLSLYIADRLTAGKKVSTIKRRVSAIAQHHRADGSPSPLTPEVSELLRGARRLRCDRLRQVRPLEVEQVRAISKLLEAEGTPIALRDRCILVVGIASALRSANLAALTLADVEFTARGAVLHIGRSKTDQVGRGMLIALPPGDHPETCPVRCLREWIARRGSYPGPLFTRLWPPRSIRPLAPERFCQIVHRSVKRIGLDAREYGSHSLRSGFVTAAGEGGASELLIAATTGHKDMATLRRYFRHRDLFRTNACAALGL